MVLGFFGINGARWTGANHLVFYQMRVFSGIGTFFKSRRAALARQRFFLMGAPTLGDLDALLKKRRRQFAGLVVAIQETDCENEQIRLRAESNEIHAIIVTGEQYIRSGKAFWAHYYLTKPTIFERQSGEPGHETS